jgi:hypothetical protein
VIRKLANKYIELFEGGYGYSPLIREIYAIKYGIRVGYGMYGGCWNIANITRGVVFGDFSSAAANVKIFWANHPLGEIHDVPDTL